MATRETKPARPTPEWLIERLAANDLSPTAADAVRRRLAEEGRSAEAETARLAASNREILEASPPDAVAAEVRRRADSRQRAEASARRPRRTWVLGGALVAAGALALVLIPRPAPHGAQTVAPEYIGIKNDGAGARLYVYRHESDGDTRLGDGARANRGDLLQLTYATSTAHQAFGVLLSIDGAGHVTQHWPEAGSTRAAALRAGGEVRLPSAYQLDDAPGFERFFLVWTDRPFEVAPVLQAARALGAQPSAARRAALSLPSELTQVSLALDKPRLGSK
jgi:hypothetical protein